MKKIITCASVVSFGVCASVFLPTGSAHADLCQYPGAGVGASVILGRGGYCDYPTEIKGSHLHCEDCRAITGASVLAAAGLPVRAAPGAAPMVDITGT
jgi:hypothetical protein